MNKNSQKQENERLFKEAQSRARSITVGTAFGGITEISMRRGDGLFTYAILQPVETIELIHQMAASIGCHIHIQPRADFGSWRDWGYTPEQLAHFRGEQYLPGVGHPPISKSPTKEQSKQGAVLPPPEQQPGLQPALMARSDQDEQIVATQKTVGRKRTKRAAAAA